MPKQAKTPSFILELPLTASQEADRALLGRMEAGRRLYNVVLQEALSRLNNMRDSAEWQATRELSNSPERTAAFRNCAKAHEFTEYALHATAAKHKNAAGYADRMSANELQKLASRVWKAVSEYAFGKRGKPRFKSAALRPLKSIEGKTNKAGVRWQQETGCVVWNGIYLPARLPSAAQDPWLTDGLTARTKYVRLVWRIEHGKRRWFAQLIQEGDAPKKYEFLATGQVVALDIGPSKVAFVSDDVAALEKLAPGVDDPAAKKRRLQRAIDRSRRANNPKNFNDNGTIKKGRKVWKKSKRYKKLQSEAAEVERKLAARRKTEHGTLANKVLGLGTVIQAEKLSYKSFQRNYGKSVKNRAPGMFISLLKRKAESAGGEFRELNTWRLRMSQYDHVSDTCEKKPLNQRWHRLGGTGAWVQRDAYSAWLAQNVRDGEHNPSQLKLSWPATESLLRRVGLCVDERTKGQLHAEPVVAIPVESVARQRAYAKGLSRNMLLHVMVPLAPGVEQSTFVPATTSGSCACT